ncbi:hypothetical protein Stok01_01190 [Sulfurisphaera tokodaii]
MRNYVEEQTHKPYTKYVQKISSKELGERKSVRISIEYN